MRTNLLSSRSGASALEFAILSPVFVFLLLAILSYGLYFAVAHGVQQVAAEAARAAVAGLDAAERDALARARAEESVETYPFLTRGNMFVTSGADSENGDLFRITVRYDAAHLGLEALAGLVPLPSTRIARSSVIRRGGH